MADKQKTILYFTGQPVYRSGEAATGGGLRAYSLGQALKERGFDVAFVEPGDGSSGLNHSVNDIPDIISDHGPDVVILGNWGISDRIRECPVPTVVDLNGSLILENSYRGKRDLLGDFLGKLRALEKVDLVLAGSERQKMYLSAWCLLAGMSPEAIPVSVVPFSLSPDMPEPQPPPDPVFIMAGYSWPWLEGNEVVRTVSDELGRLERGLLKVYTSEPPYFDLFPDEESGTDRGGTLDFSGLPRIDVSGKASFDELVNTLGRCSVGLDLWKGTLERELAISSRAVVYLWSGLPIITNRGGGLADLVREYGAGWVLDPGDPEALKDLVRAILEKPHILDSPRKGARKLATERFTWDRTVGPLEEFCRSPLRKRHTSPVLEVIGGLEGTVNQLDGVRKTLEVQKKQLEDDVQRAMEEITMFSDVHRRPRGLEAMFSRKALWSRIRRMVMGVPVLFYLLALAKFGEVLSNLRHRMGMG